MSGAFAQAEEPGAVPVSTSFKSGRLLALLACCGFALWVATHALHVAMRALELAIPDWGRQVAGGRLGAVVFAIAFGWAAIAQLAAIALASVPFLAWIHRAATNARVLGRRRPHSTPAMAVLCWFIPFLNWFRPYRVVKALYWASETPNAMLAGDWLRRQPLLLPVWWGSVLVAGILENAAYLTHQHRVVATLLLLLSLPVDIVAALCAAAVTWSIQVRQEHLALVGEAAFEVASDDQQEELADD